MSTFSANLGFLWTELSLPEAIRQAKHHGFAAVECHWPYSTPSSAVRHALEETGLTMLGLNTIRGNLDQGENGLSALPGREIPARSAIDQAIEYATSIATPNIHVMAGFAQGKDAHDCFIDNLRYAADEAKKCDITILIEPLNHHDAPGYFLQTSDQARRILDEVNADNVKLMFDCYHIQIMEGDISRRLKSLTPYIGHIQIASVPWRNEPDQGELDYRHIMKVIRDIGFSSPIGAEYRPTGKTSDSLGWMNLLNETD